MKASFLQTILLPLVAAAMAGCSDDLILKAEEPSATESESECIVFTVRQSESASRGGSHGESRPAEGFYIQSDSDSLYMALEVSDADVYTPTTSRASYITDDDLTTLMMTCRRRTSGNSYDYYFSNIPFSLSDNVWKSDPTYWWLSDDSHYTFYGYAPAEAAGLSFIADDTYWQPKLKYEVPANVKQQTDIVYNSSVPEYISSANQTVPLTMSHALANITFTTGSDMQTGRITAVRIRNVIGSGTLNLTTGKWSLDEATKDFASGVSVQSGDNVAITSNEANTNFMLLPGSCTESTEVDIDITLTDGTKATYTSSISTLWEAEKQYKYTITINPQFSIDLVPETQDAHYVMARAHVNAYGLTSDRVWQLTATASDGANVTILPESELNEFQAQGFWIDEIVENGSSTNARGSGTLASTGSQYVYIFLPENVSDNNRQITLSLKLDGNEREFDSQTFEQYHPAWTSSGQGWEQVEDDSAEFGFNWDYTVYYGYVYTAPFWGSTTYENYCQSIIDENNANAYAYVRTYSYGITRLRYCIKIVYSDLNLLNYTNSQDDGLSNTIELNKFAGIAVTNSFETVIKDIKKTESGHESEAAFRLGNGATNEAKAPEGEEISGSPAVGECLKKNRYTLLKTTTTVDGDVNTAYIPQIADSDIVWYLPAVNQFSSLPTEVKDAIDPGSCWSSNADQSSGDDAYLGNGVLANRLTEHKVRACRNRP